MNHLSTIDITIKFLLFIVFWLTEGICSYLDSSCNEDPCISNPCQSNGTCLSILSSTNYTCKCPEQYTGYRCESYLNIDQAYAESRDVSLNMDEDNSKSTTELWPLAIVFGYVFSLLLVFIIIWFLWYEDKLILNTNKFHIDWLCLFVCFCYRYGFTFRPQSIFHSEIPYSERVTARYQPYRLGVSNPLFFINHEYNTNQQLKTFSNSNF